VTLKAVILAAGYAIRLRKSAKGTGYEDLFSTTPKPLLPIAGRLAIEYLTDKIRKVNPTVDELIVITNALFQDKFESGKLPSGLNIRILSDLSKDKSQKGGEDLAIAVGRDNGHTQI
jgi:NDP-sugar pyrophosphorylase family protein